MASKEKSQTKGRERNGAVPPGSHDGVRSDAETRSTGKESTRRAGPDGPDAREIGDTFKKG